MPSQTLRIRGATSELARVRRAVGAWSASAGLSKRAARQMQTAVDEAVANAIEHGLADPERGRITVRGETGRTGLTVTVRHRGERFDPTVAPVTLDDARRSRAVHGYGLHLLQRLVDDLAYEHRRGTNEVRMVKRAG